VKYDKQGALVARLYKATADGKLAWQDTTRENAFQASFPTLSVVLSYVGDDYIIQVVNSDGELADVFTDANLREVQGAPYGSHWYQTMKELYTLARRKARGADAALDEILSALDEKD